MFNASGTSTIDNVQITGISVTGSNEFTVNNLRYDGSDTSPAVTMIVITNPMAMQDSIGMSSGMMGMSGMSMMQGSQDGMMMAQGLMGSGMTWMNGTSAAWSEQSVAYLSQTSSSVLDAGWISEATVTVKLESDGSAYDGSGVHVMVFPLTS